MNAVVFNETLRRHYTNVGYLAFVAALAIAGLGVAQFQRPGAVWPSLVALLAFIAGCGPIGPEFSSGTLQLILVKPVTRSAYLVSRVAGVVTAVAAAATVAAASEVVGRLIGGAVPWARIGTALLYSIVDTILVVALLTLLGSVTRAYFNIVIYFAVELTLTVGMGLLPASRRIPPFVTEALTAIERNLYPDAPSRFDRGWLLLVLSNAAIALVLACLAFRRREVPYGAD